MLKDLFLFVLNLSITASWVILAVTIIRFLLRKSPKKYSYYLWAAVAFRLACPVSFSSKISLLAMASASAVTLQEVPVSQMVYVQETDMPEKTIQTTPPAAETAVTPTKKKVDPYAVGSFLWVSGMAVLGIAGTISYGQIAQIIRHCERKGNLCYCDGIPSPFVFGLLHPVICLPLGLPKESNRYILAHERYHIRRGDHLVKLVGYVLCVIHWFNPLVWLAYRMMEQDMEMSCDEAVIAQGKAARKDYGRLLLSFGEQHSTLYKPLSFGETDIASRIKNILSFRKPKKSMAVIYAIAVTLAVIGCSVNPSSTSPTENPSVIWTQEPSMALDMVKEPSGYVSTFTAEGNRFVMASCFNLEGYSPSWFGNWTANAIIVAENGKQGIYDYNGNELYPLLVQPKDAYQIGISRFLTGENDLQFGYLTEKTGEMMGKGMVFSDDFRSALPCETMYIDPFEGDMFYVYSVMHDGQYGTLNLMDDTFTPQLPVKRYEICRQWKEGYMFEEEKVLVYDGRIIAKVDHGYDERLINGYYGYYRNGLKGMIKATEEKKITEAVYEDVKWFEEGLCPVKYNGRWGYINEEGKPVTEYLFDDASTLYDGKAYVAVNGLYGIIDLKATLANGIPVTHETCTVWEKEEPIMRITVLPDAINIRTAPSLKADITAKALQGSSYPVYETTEAEGYTWYRVGKDRWMADDGTWLAKVSSE